MKTSPSQQVKGSFGDKAKLVSAVQALATDALWVDRVNPEKGLAHISNTKLLKLHSAFSRAQQEFGTREKLIAALLTLGKRSQDEGYKSRLVGYPVPRLLDLHDSLSKKANKPAAATPKVAGEKRQTRTKKAKLKAA